MRDYSLRGLLDPVSRHPVVSDALARVLRAEPGAVIGPLGLPEAAQPAAVAAIAAATSVPIVWIVPQVDEARALADLLSAYLDDPTRLHLFAAPDPLPFERIAWDPSVRELRMATLAALFVQRTAPGSNPGPPPVIIAPLRAVLTPTLPPAEFDRDAHVVARGDRMPVTQLVRHLHRLGYRPAAQVTERGEFSRRGGIVDVFAPHADDPVRIEWFGDEIERMRSFDVETQRSADAVQQLSLFPTRALVLPETGWPEIEERIRDAFKRAQKKLDFVAGRLKARTDQDLSRFAAFGYFEGCEMYAPFVYPSMGTLLDYLPQGAAVVWDDREHLLGDLTKWARTQDEAQAKAVKEGTLLRCPTRCTLAPRRCRGDRTDLVQLDMTARTDGVVQLEAPSAARFHSDFDKIAISINEWQHAGERVVIVTQQPQRAFAILDERGVNAALATPPETAEGEVGGVWVVRESLLEGFRVPGLRLVVLTDLELFGQQRRASS